MTHILMALPCPFPSIYSFVAEENEAKEDDDDEEENVCTAVAILQLNCAMCSTAKMPINTFYIALFASFHLQLVTIFSVSIMCTNNR